MKTLGRKYKSILIWHNRTQSHPIFDPSYARENLVSLGQGLLMLSLYFAFSILLMHFLRTLNVWDAENLSGYLIEVATKFLYFGLPAHLFPNPYVAAAFVGGTLLAAVAVHLSLDILKANLHPQASGLFNKYQSKNPPVTAAARRTKRHFRP
jgi:hypothetical protein